MTEAKEDEPSTGSGHQHGWRSFGWDEELGGGVDQLQIQGSEPNVNKSQAQHDAKAEIIKEPGYKEKTFQRVWHLKEPEPPKPKVCESTEAPVAVSSRLMHNRIIYVFYPALLLSFCFWWCCCCFRYFAYFLILYSDVASFAAAGLPFLYQYEYIFVCPVMNLQYSPPRRLVMNSLYSNSSA